MGFSSPKFFVGNIQPFDTLIYTNRCKNFNICWQWHYIRRISKQLHYYRQININTLCMKEERREHPSTTLTPNLKITKRKKLTVPFVCVLVLSQCFECFIKYQYFFKVLLGENVEKYRDGWTICKNINEIRLYIRESSFYDHASYLQI